jgi:hypothetical protein
MRTLKTHPLNVSHLVLGVIFLGIAGFWALRTLGVVDGGDARWLGPLLLVAAGGIGLVGFATKNRGRDDREDLDPAADDVPAFDPYPSYDTDPTQKLTHQDTEGELR